jgi:iron complex outermembrane receptor protein
VYQYQLISDNKFFDESLSLKLTGFFTAYSSYQSCQVRAEAFECVGGGKAQLRGVELEGAYLPYEIPGLALNFNANFLDTKIERFLVKDPTADSPPGGPNAGGPQTYRDVRGNRLPRSPLFKFAVGLQYDIETQGYGVVTPRVDFTWEGDTYFRTFNSKDVDLQKAFFMLNARLAWASEDGRFSIDGGVENITDKDVRNNIITGPLIAGSPVIGFYRPPRTWSLRFGWRWH